MRFPRDAIYPDLLLPEPRTQNPEPGNPLNIPMLQQLRVPTVNAISSRNAAPGGQLRNVNQAWL